MRRRLALLLIVGALVGGCKDGGETTADPTVPTRPTTSSSTTAATAVADIATIPPVIDEPYLNRVLAALDGVELQATRMIAKEKNVGPAAAVLLNSIYTDDEFNVQVDAWLTSIRRDPALASTPIDTPGRHTSVERVVSGSPGCMFVAVARTYPLKDLSQTEYVALAPLDPSNDPEHHNPTAWMILESSIRDDGTQPASPCPAD